MTERKLECYRGIVLFMLFLIGFVPFSARAATPRDALIKGSGPAVYYLTSDGKRYVFPNQRVYDSWFHGFGSVTVVSDVELAEYGIGGNVTYRPGIRMVKITSDPKVYAVGKGGTLHWMTSEEVAAQLYGEDWNKNIDDVPDAFFFDYRVDNPIITGKEYDPHTAADGANTINKDKDIPASVNVRVADTIVEHVNVTTTTITSNETKTTNIDNSTTTIDNSSTVINNTTTVIDNSNQGNSSTTIVDNSVSNSATTTVTDNSNQGNTTSIDNSTANSTSIVESFNSTDNSNSGNNNNSNNTTTVNNGGGSAEVAPGEDTSPHLSQVSLARSGNTVTLTFTASRPLYWFAVDWTVGGVPAALPGGNANMGGNTWVAAMYVQPSDSGAVGFEIRYESKDESGVHAGSPVSSTTDGSSVTIN